MIFMYISEYRYMCNMKICMCICIYIYRSFPSEGGRGVMLISHQEMRCVCVHIFTHIHRFVYKCIHICIHKYMIDISQERMEILTSIIFKTKIWAKASCIYWEGRIYTYYRNVTCTHNININYYFYFSSNLDFYHI
jgi:hypothetical protein